MTEEQGPGTPLSVRRSCVNPGGKLSVPNTPGPTRGTGPRCGVSPGSASFPWSPGGLAERPGLLSIRKGGSGEALGRGGEMVG